MLLCFCYISQVTGCKTGVSEITHVDLTRRWNLGRSLSDVFVTRRSINSDVETVGQCAGLKQTRDGRLRRPTPWRSNGPRYNEPSLLRRRPDDTRRRAGADTDSRGAGSRRRRARSPPRPTLNTAGPLLPPAGHPYPAVRHCKLNGTGSEKAAKRLRRATTNWRQ